VVKDRAKQAGKLLASVIAERHTVGGRPVSLVGFSMGARLIFYCLQELHRLGEFHCIADVTLFGAPVSTTFLPGNKSREAWERARAVVAGRFVNGYIRSDWVLAFLYRYMEWGVRVAGLEKVCIDGIENFDLSEVVASHDQYPDKLGKALAAVA